MEPIGYKCLYVQQRGDDAPKFVLFSAKVREVLLWAAISRVQPGGGGGAQRIEKPYKTSAIRSFFQADERNTIPSAVVIGFRPGLATVTPAGEEANLHDVTLTAPEGEMAGTIVDGQHRILGMNMMTPDMPVNIVGLLDVDDAETAFQFLVINNKASKVSTDHLRSLALKYEEGVLAQRLQKVRLNLHANLRFVGFADLLDDSPFKGILTLPSNPPESQMVPPAAIEEAVSFIRQQRLPELADDDDMIISVFFSIWRLIKTRWNAQWNADSKLLNKVSVVCLTQFIVSNLLRDYDWNKLDIYDPGAVEGSIEKYLGALNPMFWDVTTEWVAKGLDTSAGRKLLMESLEQMVRNYRQDAEWHEDISMVRVVD
jgi:DGQHR domain-containing protein